jgi:hypothetical protein
MRHHLRLLGERLILAGVMLRSEPVSYTMTGGSAEPNPSLTVTFVRGVDIERIRRAIR